MFLKFLILRLRLRPKVKNVATVQHWVFTTADPNIAIFGLCTHKWGIFVIVEDPMMQILCNDVIFKSQNPGEVDICTITNNRLGMIKCAKKSKVGLNPLKTPRYLTLCPSNLSGAV